MAKKEIMATISLEMTLAEMLAVLDTDIETLNNACASDSASAIKSAQEVLAENLKVYNTKLRRVEFEKFLSSEDPVVAALIQRDITQYKPKQDKESGEFSLVAVPKMVNLPEFDRFARKKGSGIQIFADEDADLYAETCACMLSKFIHKRVKAHDVFTWETAKQIEVTNTTSEKNLRALLQRVLDAIHEGFILEDEDWEVIRFTMTRKLSGYKGDEKAYVLKAITGKTVWTLLTDMVSKALNGYGYSVEEITLKK